MKIEIRNDTAEISGYVNAVGRDSRPIPDVRGKFVEQIEPGAFRAALERAEDVKLLLNHDKSKEYASVKGGDLTLTEDSIGLRAHAVITDAELIGKARNGELRGWSFGMYVNDAEMEERAEGFPRRHVKGLDIFEVSLIDKAKMPCYAGTSVECRSDDGEQLAELRSGADEDPEISEERSEPIDYSAVDDMIAEIRYGAVDNMLAEVRFNPYHDPSNGRFTSGGGGGGGVLVVEKGQKGKGVYVVNSSKFDNKEAENAIAAESEEFKSNVSKLKKETDRLSKHYPESYKAGDIDKDEYAAAMAELPVNIMENQKFSAIDAQGEHIVKGITVEVGGRRFGVFSAGSGTDYVTDLESGESVPMKGINISRGIMNYNHQISNAAETLTAIRNSRKLHRSFDIDGTVKELRGSDPWKSSEYG